MMLTYLDRRHYILLLVGLLIYSANIWGLSIYILDEAKNATCAAEMYRNQEWIIPTYNTELRTDKPPLHYYFMMSAYSLFGINEFAARLFSTLFGVGTLFITMLFTSRLMNKSVAFLTGLVFLASIQIATQFHLATPDPYLIFLLTITFFTFYTGYTTFRSHFLYIAYVAIGLATLAKGPIAIVLPGLVALSFLLIKKEFTWPNILRLKPFIGLGIILFIAVPWYVSVGLATDWAWTEGFFLKHNVNRFTDSMEGHGGPIFLILVFVITGLFPFSIFLPQGFLYAWKNRKENNLILFALVVVAITIGFFSIAQTKLPSYPAPCFPFAALIIAVFLEKSIESERRLSLGFISYAILACLFPLLIYFGVQKETNIADQTYLAWYFTIIPAGGILALFWYQRSLDKALFSIAGSFMITSFLFFYFVFPNIDQANPVYQAKKLIDFSDYEVISYQRFNPSFAFYASKPIPKYNTTESLDSLMASGEKYLILSQPRRKEDLEILEGYSTVFYMQDLFDPRKTVILEKSSTPSMTNTLPAEISLSSLKQ